MAASRQGPSTDLGVFALLLVGALVAGVLLFGPGTSGSSAGAFAASSHRLGGADREFSTRGFVVRLAASGNVVAALTNQIKGGCDRIVVWTAPSKKFVPIDTLAHCPNSDVGSFGGVGEIALGGGSVAWFETGGGNTFEYNLYAAPVSGGKAKNLDFTANGNGAGGDIAGGYFGQLLGAGSILAYNSWTLCSFLENEGNPSPECPVFGQVSKEKLWRISGGRRVAVKSGPSSFRLRAVGGGRMALEATSRLDADHDPAQYVGSGVVTVLTTGGALLATIPAVAGNPPRAMALSATSLVIQRRSTLEIYNPTSGALVRSLPLGARAGLQLVGSSSKLALLLGLQRLIAVRLSDGKQVAVPLPSAAKVPACRCPVDAELNDTGLFYAYNVPNKSAKGRIVFEPTARLLARF